MFEFEGLEGLGLHGFVCFRGEGFGLNDSSLRPLFVEIAVVFGGHVCHTTLRNIELHT